MLRNAPLLLVATLILATYVALRPDNANAPVKTGSSVGSGETAAAFSGSSSSSSSSSSAAEVMTVQRPPPAVVRSSSRLPSDVIDAKRKKLKTILYWNEFYGRYDTYDFGFGQAAFAEKRCARHDCFVTKDRSLVAVDDFDAVVIHIGGLPNDWPASRKPHQRYIMLSISAPTAPPTYRRLDELAFNWTMTYRLDSDFPVPYAWITHRADSPLPAVPGSREMDRYIRDFGRAAVRPGGRNLATGKLGLAVQFASNCHTASQREAYVRELVRHVPVDVYGKCGDFECDKARGAECYRMAEAKYKFVLAFEDALCRDYVTERFYTALSLDLIPVVLGGANYSKLAPPHSYINAADFESPQALAHYLKLLDGDDARFNEYFWWKDHYRREFRHHQALCDVCERLHAESGATKTYADMHDWWVTQAECKATTAQYLR